MEGRRPIFAGRRRPLIDDALSVMVSAFDCMTSGILRKVVLLHGDACPILGCHTAEAFVLDPGNEVCSLSESHAP